MKEIYHILDREDEPMCREGEWDFGIELHYLYQHAQPKGKPKHICEDCKPVARRLLQGGLAAIDRAGEDKG